MKDRVGSRVMLRNVRWSGNATKEPAIEIPEGSGSEASLCLVPIKMASDLVEFRERT